MIYLDHNATTNVHPVVQSKINELLPLTLNPSSIHSGGRLGKSLLEKSRKYIANLLGITESARDYRITFTSGGTEANNLVLSNFKDGDIFISATEHPSIFACSKLYSNVKIVKVNREGILDLEDLELKLVNSKAHKKLVCVKLANNETGIIQPITDIARIVHNRSALLLSDCVQAAGKMNINIEESGIDFATISGHKFGGIVGAGALISREDYHLDALIIGGGQEKSLRSGTENVPAVVALGEAARLVSDELEERINHMQELRDFMESELKNNFDDIEIVGINSERLPNTSLIINPRKLAEIQLIALDMKNIAVSSGSACSSGKVGSSHVLSAMGYSQTQAKHAIRISLGRSNDRHDIDSFLKIFNELNK